MELDRVRADPHRGGDLFGVGIDEEAHTDTAVAQPPYRVGDSGFIGGDVESPFGGQLLTSLRDQADVGRRQSAGDSHHFRRDRHLEVELGAHGRHERGDIGVLDVPAVFAQMHGDAVRAAALGRTGGLDQIWVRRAARLAHGGNMVDVDAEANHRRPYAEPTDSRSAAAISSQ